MMDHGCAAAGEVSSRAAEPEGGLPANGDPCCCCCEELTEARRLAAEAERAASLRVHEAEHRADTLKRAFESKEAEVSRMRGEMLEARSAALEVAATADEAREKFLRAEERAKAAAEDARAAAVNASEKLEAAKQAAKDASFPAEKVRESMTKLVDAEGQIGGAAAHLVGATTTYSSSCT